MLHTQLVRNSAADGRFDRRLTSYSTLSAAALTTAAALASGVTAEAQTTLSAASFGGALPSATLGHDSVFQIGGHTFKFHISQGQSQAGSTYFAHGAAKLSGGIIGSIYGPAPAKGDVIPHTGYVHRNSAVLLKTSGGGSQNFKAYGQVRGGFLPATANSPAIGYVAILFGAQEFGWLRVKVTADGNGRPASAALYDNGSGIVGAYEAGSIQAGYPDAVAAVPEPANVAGGLALLALGAAGVRELRRRRKDATRGG